MEEAMEDVGIAFESADSLVYEDSLGSALILASVAMATSISFNIFLL